MVFASEGSGNQEVGLRNHARKLRRTKTVNIKVSDYK